MIEARLSITFESIMKGKLFNWRRRSLITYFISSLLISLGMSYILNTFSTKSFVDFTAGTFAVLILISLLAILISAKVMHSRLLQSENNRFTIQFSSELIRIIRQNAAIEEKAWSWIKESRETASSFIMRAKDGLFQQIYIFIPKRYFRDADIAELRNYLAAANVHTMKS